ncbi:MAG: sigma 54-interacting transcriptional regulator [bacterium]
MAHRLKMIHLDPQPSFLRLSEKLFKAHATKVITAMQENEFHNALHEHNPDFICFEPMMFPHGAKHFIDQCRQVAPDAKIIAISENASLQYSTNLMREGCLDFLVKPISANRIAECMNLLQLRLDGAASPNMEKSEKSVLSHSHFIGSSDIMREINTKIAKMAISSAPLFITGQSGTGKEVCATSLHDHSDRSSHRFVAINCAALPSNLIESEIFGHVKGAYTGAHEDRAGAAEQAHRGTLFLDEICELDIVLQAKLLRFLQTGEYRKIGSDKVQHADIRIICATNRIPLQEIDAGNFRADLFYRLNVLNIYMPPLHARGEDILELAQHFLEEYCRTENCRTKTLRPSLKAALLKYSWPGNIRELQNALRRAIVISHKDELGIEDFPFLVEKNNITADDTLLYPDFLPSAPPSTRPASPSTHAGKRAEPEYSMIDIKRPFTEIEREIIESVLKIYDGNPSKAAKALGLSPSTLYRKLSLWNSAKKDDLTVTPLPVQGVSA